MDLPEPHPDPPADLDQYRLPLYEAPGSWIRSHPRGRGPLFFGSTGLNRFDAPAQQYGILYVAVGAPVAFIETFGNRLDPDVELDLRIQQAGISTELAGPRPRRNLVRVAELGERLLARVTSNRPLRLVDITGAGLAQIGADGRLTTGSYAVAHRWALALHEHPDGLLYRCRYDLSGFCAAIFDRSADALSATALGSLADASNATLLSYILDRYGFGLRFGLAEPFSNYLEPMRRG